MKRFFLLLTATAFVVLTTVNILCINGDLSNTTLSQINAIPTANAEDGYDWVACVWTYAPGSNNDLVCDSRYTCSYKLTDWIAWLDECYVIQ